MRMNEEEDDDDDDKDVELEFARRESLRQFEEDTYRMTKGAQYDTGGGSSSQAKRRGLGRSFTVHERGKATSRFAPASTPASRLNAIEVELEKNKAQGKQTKLGTKWFKQQKLKLMKAFGNFVVHNRLPFAIADSTRTRPLLRTAAEVGPNVPLPTPYEIAEFGKATSGLAYEVKQILLGLSSKGRHFWERANEIIVIEEPSLKVVKLVDGDIKPTMGFIYEAIERAKLAIKQNCRSYVNYWRIIDNRGNFQLHHDLHATGHYLNPQFQYRPRDIGSDREVMLGLKNVIQQLEPNLDNQAKALNQMLTFRDKMESFGSPLAQRAIKFTNPAEWWI
ncbi:hypothetical protein DITRI_Ditri03aG0041900 [Diplodiscus trichospermus]